MEKVKILFIFGFILVNIIKLSECIDCSVTPKNTEIRLKQKILCSYDKDSRPIDDSKNGTVVSVKMFLKSFDFRDYSGMIDLSSWLGMLWIDKRLKWDPAEYDGIESLTIHSDEIWMPDLAIYNSRYQSDEMIRSPAEAPIETTQFEESCSASHCVLYSSGSVSCIPPCSHSGHCQGIYTNWPFDIQNCTLHFGSWMHKGSEITYKAVKLQIDSNAITNSEWKIASINYTNVPGHYSCCPNETYPSIRINIVVERHSASEVTYIVTPALILCVINLAVLWLSPNCNERILLNSLSLLSHFIFQQQLSWLVPRNGDTAPKALTYFRDSAIISTILLLQTIILRGILSCKSATPSWIKSTTESLQGNRIGQLMFTNPYLIKGTHLNNEDSSNLVEEQPVEANKEKVEEVNNVWVTTVRVFDSLMFICLALTYLILLIGWLPSPKSKFPGGIRADIIDTDE